MTPYAAEARELVALAQSENRELIIGYPWHFAPQVIHAREILQSGAMGAVQYVNCTLASSVAGLLGGDEHFLDHAEVYPVHGPGAVYSDPVLSGGGQGHLQITHAAGLMFFVAGLRAQRVLALMHNHSEHGLTFVDAFPHVGPAYSLNHPDPALRAAHRPMLTAFLDFSVAIGLSGVTFSPGRYWAGQTPAADFERAAGELRCLVAEGSRRGQRIRIEPHIESVTWSPDLALDMLAAVPGLSLTLDYSHFTFHAMALEHIARLDPYATHWHARQAGHGNGQARLSDGVIDFARIIHGLHARGYAGTLCLEYVHGDWVGLDGVDCVSETVKLRHELRRWL